MGRQVKKQGMVRMSKDGVSHDFVPSTVKVWEERGWKVDKGQKIVDSSTVEVQDDQSKTPSKK